jgi:hypothetical protein
VLNDKDFLHQYDPSSIPFASAKSKDLFFVIFVMTLRSLAYLPNGNGTNPVSIVGMNFVIRLPSSDQIMEMHFRATPHQIVLVPATNNNPGMSRRGSAPEPECPGTYLPGHRSDGLNGPRVPCASCCFAVPCARTQIPCHAVLSQTPTSERNKITKVTKKPR